MLWRNSKAAATVAPASQALEGAKDAGLSHVILDGKIIPADGCREKTVGVRGEAIDLWYSGKAHTRGGNIQDVLAPNGFPLWVCRRARLGARHYRHPRPRPARPLARRHRAGQPRRPRLRRRGRRHSHPGQQPPGRRELDINTRSRNAVLRSLRCLGERGFGLLTGRRRTLQHVTASPSKSAASPAWHLLSSHSGRLPEGQRRPDPLPWDVSPGRGGPVPLPPLISWSFVVSM